MMRKAEGIIFDMDGTLYPFDRGSGKRFAESAFGQQIHANSVAFFEQHFRLDQLAALAHYQDVSQRFDGEVSLGLEYEHGVPRRRYFDASWDLNPNDFMEPQSDLPTALGRLTAKKGILSLAPTIWVNRVLNHLQVRDVFEPSIFDGEPDIRKPDPAAFLQVARFWGTQPGAIIAIGDQEDTDIAPAQDAGMITLRIGSPDQTTADFAAPDIFSALTLLEKEKLL